MILAQSMILRFLQKIAEKAERILDFQKRDFLRIKYLLYCIDGLTITFFLIQPCGVQGF